MSNVYDHYLFAPDTAWLRRNAYDLLKGGSEAMQEWLVRKPHPRDGSKVRLFEPAPAYSPENGEDEATACAQQQTADLWKHTLEAGRILGVDADFRTRLQADFDMLDKGLWISPRDGRLQEFLTDGNEGEEIRHRHVSHLLALYPFSDISPLSDAKTAAAARKALVKRGVVSVDGAGWSLGHKVGLWARLGEGDSAYAAYSRMIANNVFPNLWQYCYADVIQMDGGQGAPAGAAEMLAQSHIGNQIQLLPALPSRWPKGSVKGLRCRNGFTIAEMSWQAGKLEAALIRSDFGAPCRLRGTDYTVTEATGAQVDVKSGEGVLTWNTVRGRTYKVVPGTPSRLVRPGRFPGPGGLADRFKVERSGLGLRIFVPATDAPVRVTLHDEKGAQLASFALVAGWNRFPARLPAGRNMMRIRVGGRSWVRALPL